MRAKAIGNCNCNCNASSRAHYVCVRVWVCSAPRCAALILRRMTVHDPNKSHCTRQQRRQMASHSLTHSLAHSLTHSLSHALTRWRRRRHCAKTKLQQKSAARTQNEAECNEQHSAHTHSHTQAYAYNYDWLSRARERDEERRCAALRCSRTSCDADVAMRNLREILQESLNSRRVSVI